MKSWCPVRFRSCFRSRWIFPELLPSLSSCSNCSSTLSRLLWKDFRQLLLKGFRQLPWKGFRQWSPWKGFHNYCSGLGCSCFLECRVWFLMSFLLKLLCWSFSKRCCWNCSCLNFLKRCSRNCNCLNFSKRCWNFLMTMQNHYAMMKNCCVKL